MKKKEKRKEEKEKGKETKWGRRWERGRRELWESSSPLPPLLSPSLFSCFCLLIFTLLFPPPLPPSLPRPPAASVCLYINNSRWQTSAFSSLTCQPEARHALFPFLFSDFAFFLLLWNERLQRQVDVKFLFLLSVELNTPPPPPPPPRQGI